MTANITNMGKHSGDVEATLADLKKRNVVERIWKKDHTVWKPEPDEITNRLGWLTCIQQMRRQVDALTSFASEVRESGFRHVVLLGMGGSSLGPEVLRQTFGSAGGYPELIVLDSTVPSRIMTVADSIDLAHTLFLVSSKSGTTIEPNSLFLYFESLVATAVGKENTGNNFIAITDPGTSLAELASAKRFRRTFINPPDIGGRYSVLSYFGLVPASLIGVDIAKLLDRAGRMQKECNEAISLSANPGAGLGAVMGKLALSGLDKLTLFTSPSIGSLGLWIEQLIAESLGKDGKGIVPVAGEPFVDTERYGEDRLFVCLRVSNDDNSALDHVISKLRLAGRPLVLLDMEDRYDLGAQFFHWEFATAIAGAIMGVHPFDQPNVQSAKQATENILKEYIDTGEIHQSGGMDLPASLLSGARSHNYLAVLAYVQQTSQLDGVMSEFRRRIVDKFSLATTFGYGPRYLHSTGQLHKGGPNTGLYLLITAQHESDISISGRPYSFSLLADAQAIGDLRALRTAGRRVARVHLGRGDAAAISRLFHELG
ncbi:MAG: glucose-6-phosphate isomerase [Chloroflexota bacterium]